MTFHSAAFQALQPYLQPFCCQFYCTAIILFLDAGPQSLDFLSVLKCAESLQSFSVQIDTEIKKFPPFLLLLCKLHYSCVGAETLCWLVFKTSELSLFSLPRPSFQKTRTLQNPTSSHERPSFHSASSRICQQCNIYTTVTVVLLLPSSCNLLPDAKLYRALMMMPLFAKSSTLPQL